MVTDSSNRHDPVLHSTRLQPRWVGRIWPILLWLALGLFLGPGSVQAAANPPLEIQVVQVNTTRFPKIETWVWLWDGAAQEVPPALPKESFTVLEDGQPVPVQNVRRFSPGMQVVLALNPAKAFAIRDNRGVSRYEYIFYQLRSWLETVTEGQHELSLLIAGGPLVPQVESPQPILEALESYTPPREARIPNLAPLVEAIRIAQQAPPRPGMVKTVLFITAPLEETYLNGLPALADQARTQNIQVSVWVVGNRAEAASQMPIWETFVQQTQGHVLLFTGTEVLPDLKTTFARRDRLYALEYVSQRREGGDVNLQVEVTWQEQTSRSPAFRFFLDLRPPTPVLEDIPETIVRVYARPEDKGTPESLKPSQWRFPFHVEFPDNIQRELRRAVLYVDETPVAELNGPPFEQILWDLTPYTEPGTRNLRLEVEDIFGLRGSTPTYPIRILITEATPPPSTSESLPRWETGFPWSWLFLGLSGFLLLMVLIWGSWMEYRGKRLSSLLSQRRPRPEVPASPSQSQPRPDRWLELVPLNPEEDGFVVQAGEVVVGSDPEQASWVLKDPSISSRHARLWYDAQEQRFYIADQGSVAGTWVNYAPVSSTGLALESGDILHLGKKGFRVLYIQPEA